MECWLVLLSMKLCQHTTVSGLRYVVAFGLAHHCGCTGLLQNDVGVPVQYFWPESWGPLSNPGIGSFLQYILCPGIQMVPVIVPTNHHNKNLVLRESLREPKQSGKLCHTWERARDRERESALHRLSGLETAKVGRSSIYWNNQTTWRRKQRLVCLSQACNAPKGFWTAFINLSMANQQAMPIAW